MIDIEKIEPQIDVTCDWLNNECFDIAKWFVEGFFYCDLHKAMVIRIYNAEREKIIDSD